MLAVNSVRKPKITIFHCMNSLIDLETRLAADTAGADVHFVPLGCAVMVKEIYLMRAFEAGADTVLVLVCPQATCRHAEGSIRAQKRVARVKALLDEIGLDTRRLSFFHLEAANAAAVIHRGRQTVIQTD